ncbi:MAG: type II toxin-antitoxin system HicA family toxin [Dehalococcoidia bacterium]|nr:type II toxin-antitoxin system HicA family toxin [Dehalococcoidia bacterium]
MPKLPILKGKEVLDALTSTKGGFFVHHQRGSHARLKHQTKKNLRVTIPIHSKDLPDRTLRRILKQAGLSDEEFLKLLK